MNYITIQQQFGDVGLFSTQEVHKRYPAFDDRRLVEWQQKNYIQRVANRWYLFLDTPLDEHLLWWTANRIYQPSYLSLETALSYYGLIPEGVYALTSITSRKTKILNTAVGSFTYRHLKPNRYFGYRVLRPTGSATDRPVLMAYLEKALLDYLYLNTHLNSIDDFAALRLNATLLRDQLDRQRLRTYLDLFGMRQLTRRVAVLHQYIDSYA